MSDISMLRHAVATVAYRGSKALRGVSPEVASYRASPTTRTPLEILSHIGDLYEWALSIANGKQAWPNTKPASWDDEVRRFFAALEAFDRRLASDEPISASPEKLFQGPVADSLTHIGQIAALRRMAGSQMRGENYFVAPISTGNVGPDQASPVREFD